MRGCGNPKCNGGCSTCLRVKGQKDGFRYDCETPWWAIALWVLAFLILAAGIGVTLAYVISNNHTLINIEHKLHEIHEKIDYHGEYGLRNSGFDNPNKLNDESSVYHYLPRQHQTRI